MTQAFTFTLHASRFTLHAGHQPTPTPRTSLNIPLMPRHIVHIAITRITAIEVTPVLRGQVSIQKLTRKRTATQQAVHEQGACKTGRNCSTHAPQSLRWRLSRIGRSFFGIYRQHQRACGQGIGLAFFCLLRCGIWRCDFVQHSCYGARHVQRHEVDVA